MAKCQADKYSNYKWVRSLENKLFMKICDTRAEFSRKAEVCVLPKDWTFLIFHAGRISKLTYSGTSYDRTIILTWSAHQYQIDAGICPIKNAGHGISLWEGSASLNILHESTLGKPQVEFSNRTLGMAAKYLVWKAW